MHRVQRGAGVACPRDGRGARSAIRAADAVPLLRMPGLWPDLLGGHALAADARGAARPMRDVLRRLVAGELTEEEALAEIRRVQLDELAGRARLDLGRYLRRGVPEVVLGAGKSPEQTAQLVVALAGRMGQGLVSRMSDAHRAALLAAASGGDIQDIFIRLAAFD